MNKIIMILGAGEAQIPVIKECKKLGFTTIVVDCDRNAPGFQYADTQLYISTINEPEILDAAKKYKIDGILTTSDYPVRVVASVCKNMNLSGLSMKSAEICTNKFLLRECLKANGILTPNYLKISNNKEIEDLPISFKFPLIVKPVDSSASRGVKKVRDFIELQYAFSEAKKYSKCGDIIIEEFIEGTEYSVETLSIKGVSYIIALTEKTTKGAEDVYFVEDRHIIPANLRIEDEIKIKNSVLEAIKTIGLDNCATHTELKLTKQGPIIIEIGARLGGDYITSDLVPLATGINMLKNVIYISINNNIDSQPTQFLYSGIQFINSENYHFVNKHLKKIEQMRGYVKSEVKEYKENDLKSSLDRLGYYICVSDTRQGLEMLLNY